MTRNCRGATSNRIGDKDVGQAEKLMHTNAIIYVSYYKLKTRGTLADVAGLYFFWFFFFTPRATAKPCTRLVYSGKSCTQKRSPLKTIIHQQQQKWLSILFFDWTKSLKFGVSVCLLLTLLLFSERTDETRNSSRWAEKNVCRITWSYMNGWPGFFFSLVLSSVQFVFVFYWHTFVN